MLTVIFKYHNCLKKFLIDEGSTILDIARKKNLDIEGSCEGSLACSTCHVLVEDKWFDKIIPANDDEKEILALLPDLKKNSRLGCQVKLTKNLDGIEIIIPKK